LLLGRSPDKARAERPDARVRIHVCTHAACNAQGAEAVLADLEELGSHCGVSAIPRACMNLCGQGPNCEVEDLVESKKRQVVKSIDTFDTTLYLLRRALGGVDPRLPAEVVKLQRPRSEAARLLARDMARPSDEVVQDMLEVERLMTQVIDLESAVQAELARDPERVASLRDALMQRGRARGRCALCDAGRRRSYGNLAIEDFVAVLTAHPLFAPAQLELGRVYSFLGRLQESVEAHRRAVALSTSDTEFSAQAGFRLRSDEVKQVQRTVAKLEERIASGTKEGEDDSGHFDGSGRWRIEGITGVSWDTCIYHARAKPPSEPHPFPHDAWHVACRFGGGPAREYTPMSTAEDWEAGKLDLLVKTYPDGIVSSEFGKLLTVEEAEQDSRESYTALDDQPCWVWVSKPAITLYLPSCLESPPPASGGPVVDKVGIVVGGTGVAPALQLLREVADPDGAFAGKGQGALLCSSHTMLDVLCLDELRAIEQSAPDRIKVRHTLTAASPPKEAGETGDADDEESEEDPWESAPHLKLKGKHSHFASFYDPFEPEGGYVGKADGDAPPLYGRVNEQMLRDLLPAPGPATRIITCGPPGMQEAVKRIVLSLGHESDALIELAGTIGQTKRPMLGEEDEDEGAQEEEGKPRCLDAAPLAADARHGKRADARDAMGKDIAVDADNVQQASSNAAAAFPLKIPCLSC